MKIEEIKEKIQFAMDAVKSIPEPFKIKAFEVVLSKLVEEPLHKVLPPIHEGAQPTQSTESVKEKIAKLAKEANIEEERLKDILDFQDKRPIFIGRIEETDAEKQVQISELILLVMHQVYGHEWVKGSLLHDVLQECNVGSLQHLGDNLRRRRNEFSAKGQRKGREYKLTDPGKRTALDLLRRLTG